MKKVLFLVLLVVILMVVMSSIAFAADDTAGGFRVNITEIVIALIGIVFTGIIIPVVNAAFKWLTEKTGNDALRRAIQEAQVVADGVVAALQVNVVEGLKAGNADGKLTADEAREVMEMAIGQFLCDLSEKSLNVIESNANDAAQFIGNMIEQRLALYKK